MACRAILLYSVKGKSKTRQINGTKKKNKQTNKRSNDSYVKRLLCLVFLFLSFYEGSEHKKKKFIFDPHYFSWHHLMKFALELNHCCFCRTNLFTAKNHCYISVLIINRLIILGHSFFFFGVSSSYYVVSCNKAQNHFVDKLMLLIHSDNLLLAFAHFEFESIFIYRFSFFFFF